MADVELVIKLSEKDCEHIKRLGALWIGSERGLSIVSKALLNGTILPKGHGNLGDLDALEQFCCTHEIANSALDGHAIVAKGKYSDGDSIWEDLFDPKNVPTLVQADKQEGNCPREAESEADNEGDN